MTLIKDLYPYLKLFPDRDIGIEIEMEGQNLINKCPGWVCEHDGSLRGSHDDKENMEYVLKIPVVKNNVSKYLKRLQKALEFNKSVLNPSERCGVHVHVNCQDMSLTNVFNYAVLYLILEDIMVKYCGVEREGNLFALRLKDAEGLLFALIKAAKAGTFFNLQKNEYRYASLNFTSLNKYGSLEFRAMKSSKDFSTIDTWVKILLSIRDRAVTYKHPCNIIEEFSFQGVDGFIERVLGEYAPLVDFPDNKRLLVEGVRRVQDIAFAYVPHFPTDEIEQDAVDEDDARPRRAGDGIAYVFNGGGNV